MDSLGSDVDTISVVGVEDGEEFDEAYQLTTHFCEQLTVEEFEDQSATETDKALAVRTHTVGLNTGISPFSAKKGGTGDLMVYMDSHQDKFTEMIRKRKRQDLENGGLLSFMKVKVLDIIHGENSPALRVSEKERERKLQEMKTNMVKAFDISLESKGRRCSSRLAAKRRYMVQTPGSTPSRKQTDGAGSAPSQTPTSSMAPPPPPPPPPPPLLGQTPTSRMKIETRKPFTPIQNRMKLVAVTPNMKKTGALDDSLGSLPALDCSLTSLHQELLSSNPWKRLKCVDENRSPGGTPTVAKRGQDPMTPFTPSDPLHQALINKFRNVRSPSPLVESANTTLASPSEFTP